MKTYTDTPWKVFFKCKLNHPTHFVWLEELCPSVVIWTTSRPILFNDCFKLKRETDRLNLYSEKDGSFILNMATVKIKSPEV